MSKKDDTTAILLAIDDKLNTIVDLLKMANNEKIEAEQENALSTPLRKNVYDLCDGKNSVTQIADKLKKSIQQISNNIVILQGVRLIKEVRKGKKKFYVRRD